MYKSVSAIVLAAGKGSRMQSKTKKQFMSICDKPMLYYSIKAFEESAVDQIVVVTSEEDIDFVQKEIVEKYSFAKVTDIVVGGAERYNSVINGLDRVTGDIVLVHDGARPLVTDRVITNCIEATDQHMACVVGVPVKDTIKVVNDDLEISHTPDRKQLYITQTPQGFMTDILRCSYITMIEVGDTDVTDDAMVVERYANLPKSLYMAEGDYRNIKVTTPEDIVVAEALLKSSSK